MPYLLIRLSQFFDKLRQNKHIQIFLALIPCVFCFLYSTVFLVDVFHIFGAITINSKAVEESIIRQQLLEAVSFDEDRNVVSDGKTLELDMPNDDEKFLVIIPKILGFGIRTNNEFAPYLYATGLNFVTYDSENKEYIVDGFDEHISADCDEICYITRSNNKYYLHIDESEKSVELKDTINFEKVDDKIIVNNKYFVPKMDSLELYFVNNLEENKTYYDAEEKMYIQQISKDYYKNFLLGSNVYLFTGVILIYVVALGYASYHFKLKYFTDKRVLVCNVFGCFTLLLAVLLSIILFK